MREIDERQGQLALVSLKGRLALDVAVCYRNALLSPYIDFRMSSRKIYVLKHLSTILYALELSICVVVVFGTIEYICPLLKIWKKHFKYAHKYILYKKFQRVKQSQKNIVDVVEDTSRFIKKIDIKKL